LEIATLQQDCIRRKAQTTHEKYLHFSRSKTEFSFHPGNITPNKIFSKAFRKYFWNYNCAFYYYLIVETIYAAFFAEMSKKRQRCPVVNLENTFSMKLCKIVSKLLQKIASPVEWKNNSFGSPFSNKQ
jgi:hypothetical protein